MQPAVDRLGTSPDRGQQLASRDIKSNDLPYQKVLAAEKRTRGTRSCHWVMIPVVLAPTGS